MIRKRILILLALLCSPYFTAAQQPARPLPTVDVILWFDTEDYILPASDDAALKLANWLTEQKIQATFKVVGEKARVLEKRGRTDVIEALKKHEIGYHSNWHSIPPTPAQYLDACGWADGVAEFTRREKPGYNDVARIFGQRPTCYGQPGSSWGPQSHAALHQWGMRIYLDAGNHINVEGKPFWYGGLLNFYKLTHQIRVGLNYSNELEDARIKFLRARDQLLSEGGGVISIVYHPCEFVHQQFWDGVNFKHGANPPREQWKLPPVKTEAESKLAYHNFEEYVLFMKRFPGVRFVTATQAAEMYPNKKVERLMNASYMRGLAVQCIDSYYQEGIHWVQYEGATLSASEVFWYMTMAMHLVPMRRPQGTYIQDAFPALIQGPSEQPGECTSFHRIVASRDELVNAATTTRDYLLKHQQIPSSISIGTQRVTPEAYLLLLVDDFRQRAGYKPKERPKTEPLLYSKKNVADDGPHLWRWVIFPPGFQAPNVMAQAKLQAWTLKPALRRNP